MVQTVETGFVTTLAEKLEAADTEMVVAVAPTVTKGRLYLTNGAQEEWIQFSGVSGTTLQNLTRGMSKTALPSTAGVGKTWLAGTVIELVIMHDQLYDRLEGDPILASATVYATTAARDSALGGDGVATKAYFGIYVAATGLHYNYNLSSNEREPVDSGTVTPNASTDNAGKVKIATPTQVEDGDADDDGVPLVATPEELSAQIQSGQWVAGVDAGEDDTYVFVMTPTLGAYISNQVFNCKVTTANTGACSADFWPWALAIKTRDWNDPQSWAIRENSVFQLMYNGTNFTLLSEDFATTGNRWLIELSTDAEWLTGTSTTLVPSINQLNRRAILQTTRAINWASWTVNLAHWLWVVPKYVYAVAKHANGGSSVSYASAVIWSEWYSDFTTNRCSYSGFEWGDGTHRDVLFWNQSALIYVRNSDSPVDGRHQTQSATVTADATNIIFDWTYSVSSSSLSNNIVITLFVFA